MWFRGGRFSLVPISPCGTKQQLQSTGEPVTANPELPITPHSIFYPCQAKTAPQAFWSLGHQWCCLAHHNLDQEFIKTCSQALLTMSKNHHTCNQGKREAALHSTKAKCLLLPHFSMPLYLQTCPARKDPPQRDISFFKACHFCSSLQQHVLTQQSRRFTSSRRDSFPSLHPFTIQQPARPMWQVQRDNFFWFYVCISGCASRTGNSTPLRRAEQQQLKLVISPYRHQHR